MCVHTILVSIFKNAHLFNPCDFHLDPSESIDVDPPTIDPISNGRQTAYFGDVVRIPAVIRGSQPIELVWTHNNSRVIVSNTVVNGSHFLITENNQSSDFVFSYLTISNVNKLTQGIYKINASNSVGSAQSKGYHITGKGKRILDILAFLERVSSPERSKTAL